jgi:hypothetical protein
MRDEEAIVMTVFFMTAAAVVWLALAYWHKRERLRTVQRAIDSGALDEATRRAVLDALAADARRAAEFWPKLGSFLARAARVIVFVGGWITLFVGGGVWIAMEVTGGAHRYELQAAMIATFVGFALVTLPMAMREMNGRRVASPP